MGLKHIFRRKTRQPQFLCNGAFVTTDAKPVIADEYRALSDVVRNRNQIAIVLQGPLKTDWNFTIETLKIYKKNFAGCILIVSTWETESPTALQIIEDMGVTVVRNCPPAPSFLNMNHQIVSTIAGLRRAQEMGAQWALKTRTDQRLYETNIPEFLMNMIELFPLKKHIDGQKHRLIITSFNTFKYRLYDPSDMFLFGDIDDVVNYWSCPCLTKSPDTTYRNLRDFCQMRPAEIYFFTNFLERTGREIKWTLADSWDAYSERLCIVDTASVGLYWPKYSTRVNRFRNFYGRDNLIEELTFKEWLDLYMHDGTKEYIPEYYVANNALNNDAQIPQRPEICTDGAVETTALLDNFDLSGYTIGNTMSGQTGIAIYNYQRTPITSLKSLIIKRDIPIVYLTKRQTPELEQLCRAYDNLYIVLSGDNAVYDFASLRILLLKDKEKA